MVKKNYKGRCVKVSISKSKAVCRTYSPMQLENAKILDKSADIKEIRCNVLLDELEGTDEYTSDIVCTKADGELMVRKCAYRKLLAKPLTATGLYMRNPVFYYSFVPFTILNCSLQLYRINGKYHIFH